MKRLINSVLLAVFLLGITSIPVSATPITATFTPSIVSAQVVRNVVETGDMSVVFFYNLATADPYPSTTATDSFIFRLYSTDGLTLLATSVPYSLINHGYGLGVGSFYFAAADAPTWGLGYKINISGSPAYFTTLPDEYNYTLSATDYSGITDADGNRVIMAAYILDVCTIMQNDIEDLYLKGTTDSGTVLTETGETYFRGSVPGITSIAPSLFYLQRYTPSRIDLDYNSDKQTEYTNRLAGSDIMAGFTATGAMIGVNGAFMIAMVFVIFAVALIVWCLYKGWGAEPGMLGSGNIISLGGILFGGELFTIQLIMGLLGGIFIFFSLWGKRS